MKIEFKYITRYVLGFSEWDIYWFTFLY